MDYAKLERFVSKPRLDRFLLSCANSQVRTIQLYGANLQVSQAFHPVLNLFETFLRNRINEKFVVHFGDPAWIINQKAGFMSHPSLGPEFWLRKQVIAAEGRIRGTITPGKIVAEQTLGFWTSLFDLKHYKLMSGYPIRCFAYKPSTVGRTDLVTVLRNIREFRNRIYHNEAICFKNVTIDFTHAQRVKTEIYNLLDWMDADLRSYVDQFDTVDAAIRKALTI
jgi:hypothetical protein